MTTEPAVRLDYLVDEGANVVFDQHVRPDVRCLATGRPDLLLDSAPELLAPAAETDFPALGRKGEGGSAIDTRGRAGDDHYLVFEPPRADPSRSRWQASAAQRHACGNGTPRPLLDQAICSYEALSAPNRAKFDRAAFWVRYRVAHVGYLHISIIAALVSAIESLTVRGNGHHFDCPVCARPTQHEVPGPTQLFRDLLATYAPGTTQAKDRNDMYALRSGILHASDLMELDRDIPVMGRTPPGFKEEELHRRLWRVTRTALRNWLKSPPPQSRYLQQARQECAYFHWIDRGRPLWEADVDWEWAEHEIPDE